MGVLSWNRNADLGVTLLVCQQARADLLLFVYRLNHPTFSFTECSADFKALIQYWLKIACLICKRYDRPAQ
jgi:hypothetical protein